MPDGSGRLCNKSFGGPATESVYWANGAALLPDKRNVLISLLGVCAHNRKINTQTWSFALYDWKSNRFTVKPFDVFPSNKAGRRLQEGRNFGSPVVVGQHISFYSWGKTIYSTTVPATLPALRQRASYHPKPIAGLPQQIPITVAGRSRTLLSLTMYQLRDTAGGYQILTANKPEGPWAIASSGVLPGCDTSPRYCMTVAIHPEMSKHDRLLLSYYLPGYAPWGPQTRPVNVDYFGHLVMSYVPI
jgi:hypothetical protein